MDKKKILGDISTKNKYYLGKKLFFISYKKGIILILILRPYQTLLVFGFFSFMRRPAFHSSSYCDAITFISDELL